MNAAAITSALTSALEAEAAREAGAPATLVSLSVEMLASPEAGEVRVSVTRKTRTLVFLSAEYVSASGVRIANASSVHKVLS